MITRNEQATARERAAQLIRDAGIPVSSQEEARIEVVDFGLGNLAVEGAQILTWVATERIGVKLLALTPGQTLPEHWHPPVENDPGKEETLRHVWGDLRVYVAGESGVEEGVLPPGKEQFYTCRHEIVMQPGDQLTCQPGEKHWFQAGPRGCVTFSFSTIVRDALDGFTDPGVDRITKVVDDNE